MKKDRGILRQESSKEEGVKTKPFLPEFALSSSLPESPVIAKYSVFSASFLPGNPLIHAQQTLSFSL
jgi:hypothetical protein